MTEPRFLEQLQELDAKAAAVREQEARGTAACADVRGVLDRLRVKVRAGGIAQSLEPLPIPPPLPLPQLMLTSCVPLRTLKTGSSPLLLLLASVTPLGAPHGKRWQLHALLVPIPRP